MKKIKSSLNVNKMNLDDRIRLFEEEPSQSKQIDPNASPSVSITTSSKDGSSAPSFRDKNG